MDGVLVDFEKGYRELTGFYTKDHPDNTKFWEPIDAAGPAYWANLEWMQDGHQLWDYIKKYHVYYPKEDQNYRITTPEEIHYFRGAFS